MSKKSKTESVRRKTFRGVRKIVGKRLEQTTVMGCFDKGKHDGTPNVIVTIVADADRELLAGYRRRLNAFFHRLERRYDLVLWYDLLDKAAHTKRLESIPLSPEDEQGWDSV